LTIVMASRNAASTISDALDSVLRYGGEAELVVVDGASTDATLQVLDRYRSRVNTLISEPDRGIYDALSKGFRAARGTWIHVLGADDKLLPGFGRLAAQLDDPGIAYYGSVRLNPSGRTYGGRFGSFRLMLQNICHQAIFFPKQHWLRLGGFDESFPLLADYAFNLRAFWDPYVRYQYVDEIVCEYHESGSSILTVDTSFALSKANLLKNHAPPITIALYRACAFIWSKMPVSAQKRVQSLDRFKLRPSGK
jgi:glycosyltransferase involved in cell wall biosynthesis